MAGVLVQLARQCAAIVVACSWRLYADIMGRSLADRTSKQTLCSALASQWHATSRLRQQLFDDFSGDVRQSHVEAAEADGEFQVVHPEQVQQRGVEVVDVDGIFHRGPAQFVGVAEGVADDADEVGVEAVARASDLAGVEGFVGLPEHVGGPAASTESGQSNSEHTR